MVALWSYDLSKFSVTFWLLWVHVLCLREKYWLNLVSFCQFVCLSGMDIFWNHAVKMGNWWAVWKSVRVTSNPLWAVMPFWGSNNGSSLRKPGKCLTLWPSTLTLRGSGGDLVVQHAGLWLDQAVWVWALTGSLHCVFRQEILLSQYLHPVV